MTHKYRVYEPQSERKVIVSCSCGFKRIFPFKTPKADLQKAYAAHLEFEGYSTDGPYIQIWRRGKHPIKLKLVQSPYFSRLDIDKIVAEAVKQIQSGNKLYGSD